MIEGAGGVLICKKCSEIAVRMLQTECSRRNHGPNADITPSLRRWAGVVVSQWSSRLLAVNTRASPPATAPRTMAETITARGALRRAATVPPSRSVEDRERECDAIDHSADQLRH